MKLEKDDLELIRKAFPEEAVQVKKTIRDPKNGNTFKVFTGFKPQYVIERLNDCFGHGGWDFEIKQIQMTDNCAWCWGKLTVNMKEPTENLSNVFKSSVLTTKEQVGSCDYDKGRISYGDSLKGAVTNCLEKCASLLDIGHEAYKGLVQPTEAALLLAGVSPDEIKTNKTDTELEPLKNHLKTLCAEHKIDKGAFGVLTKTVLGIEKDPKTLDVDEIKKLIEWVKTKKAPF